MKRRVLIEQTGRNFKGAAALGFVAFVLGMILFTWGNAGTYRGEASAAGQIAGAVLGLGGTGTVIVSMFLGWWYHG